MKVLTVIGARPQFIKAAALSPLLSSAGIDEKILHTGQHYDKEMSEVFFEELSLSAPAYNLNVGSGSHGRQTAKMLDGIEGILEAEKPDLLLVYGDTNSTLAGALAAAKRGVPIAHVEAGLRSFNRQMPEEINRILTDHMADLCFAPTQSAADRLRTEGLSDGRIHLVGDVQYDVCRRFQEKKLAVSDRLSRHGVSRGQFALVTIHRQENTDSPDRLTAILSAIEQLAGDLPVIFPAHPRTVSAAKRQRLPAGSGAPTAVKWIAPVGYADMMALQSSAGVIVTDSGGVQKEAFYLEVPCVTVRDETEWPETVELGWNRLVAPTDAARIAKAARDSIGAKGHKAQPFGDGHAGRRIVEVLHRWQAREA